MNAHGESMAKMQRSKPHEQGSVHIVKKGSKAGVRCGDCSYALAVDRRRQGPAPRTCQTTSKKQMTSAYAGSAVQG